MAAQAEIGVFGGSGFYSFLEEVEEVTIETPYGPPSDSYFIGDIGGKRVAFLPRHGRRHQHPPHMINYRANVWGMKAARGDAHHRPVRFGKPQEGGRAGALRGVRPVRRPYERPSGHVLRRPHHHPRLVGRPLLSAHPCGAGREGQGAGHHHARDGHGGGRSRVPASPRGPRASGSARRGGTSST